ncbi:ATP-binding protein [Nonomuraea sp. NPDC049421]|uniref:ATP-binding protein n=1 Tax=Nonomuraea sp. NPDC049421 TaxID=3155275 RepID=UPI00343A3834
MDNRDQHAISAQMNCDYASRPSHQQPRVAEFPDLVPGLVMSTFRASDLWSGMAWRQAFAGRADQSAPARRMVEQLLADTGRADDARWVTAELVSNALRHTRSGQAQGFFVVDVLRGTDMARIAVYDLGGGCFPDFARRPDSVPETAEQGRGLLGVAELADRVGAAGDAITGHVVWADLAYTPETVRASRSGDAVGRSENARAGQALEVGTVRELESVPEPSALAVHATACRDRAPMKEGVAGAVLGQRWAGPSGALMAAERLRPSTGKEVAGLGPRWGLWEAS